jgi:chromosome segregation ATPase
VAVQIQEFGSIPQPSIEFGLVLCDPSQPILAVAAILANQEMRPTPAAGANMGSSITQITLVALGGCFLGALIGWSIQAALSKRRIGHLISATRTKLDSVTGQRDALARKYSRSKSKIEQLQAAEAGRNTELESVLKKSKLLARNVLTLRTERENTKIKVSTIQNAMASLKQQTSTLQTEFDKAREFYKRELLKSLEKRKALEEDLKEARAAQENITKLVESATLEHGSAEDMLVAARLRLGQLDVLERNVNKLEAENEQLRRDARQLTQKFEARERDLEELEELKVHNKQLVQCVEALEDSRKEHESEAEKYRKQADQSEILSDTLRLKLDDLEKSFADMEEQQDRALESAREAAVIPMAIKQR